ncbi:MAG: hypothetical protein ACYSWW_25900 [Planctomycetota bacterium]|jgi:hypothetical protein
MSENENENSKQRPLEINVSDAIKVTDSTDVTIVESDLTVFVPGPDGKDQQIICDATCSGDSVAETVRKVMKILSEDSEWPGFQGNIEETIEIIREQGLVVDADIPVPTGWLQHVGFPTEIHPELRFKGGEKTTIRIVRTQSQEKPEGTSETKKR